MSSNTPRYIIDTCSFTALRRVYPKDIFPGVWTLIEKLMNDCVICSVEDVLEELKLGDDELYGWARNYQGNFLLLDETIQTKATLILSTHTNLVDLRKRKSGADPFLIAAAIVTSSTVVTEENPSGGPPRLKIPDVCKAYKIPCIAILEVLRREGLKLI